MEMNEKIRERIDTLLCYRDALDESEKQLFDMLIGYANEIALIIDKPSFGGRLC